MRLSEFLSFLKFFSKNKILFSSFLFLVFVFLNLSGQSYYETISLGKNINKVLGEKIYLPLPSRLPKNIAGLPVPWFSAKSILVMDSSGVILYEKNPSQKLYPASITKIMTSLVALETFSLDTVLLVPEKFNNGQKIGLSIGEQLTMQDLLKALLIASANDAAEVIAANFPGGRESFIARMNQKAKELSLGDTHFVNPSGIDEEGQFTTATDLAKLTKYALKNETFAKLVSTKSETIKSLNYEKVYSFNNVNELLGKLEGMKGVKTGFTDLAGECLVSAIERNGHLIYIVILGSGNRFGETTKIANWTYANFAWF